MKDQIIVALLGLFTIACIYFAFSARLIITFGHSMHPTIRHQQTFVALEHFPFHWKGQIINFTEDGELLTKRIGKIDGDAIYVYGDNPLDNIDSRMFGPIHRLQIVGIHLFNFPK